MSDRKTNSNSLLGYLLAAGVGAAVSYFASSLINEQQDRERRMRHSNQTRTSPKFPINPPDICVICQEPISPSLVQLPCFHIFHRNCFAKAADYNRKPQLECPICRQPIPADFELD